MKKKTKIKYLKQRLEGLDYWLNYYKKENTKLEFCIKNSKSAIKDHNERGQFYKYEKESILKELKQVEGE